MTKKEARNLLNNSKPKGNNAYSIMLNESLDMAIEALKQEPCEDAISRQAAIDAMIKIEQDDIEQYGCKIPEGFDSDPAVKALEKLPSVTSQSKTGRWIYTLEDWNKWECSECGFTKRTDVHVKLGYNYCPNCGVKMKNEAEEFDHLDEMLEKLWNEV